MGELIGVRGDGHQNIFPGGAQTERLGGKLQNSHGKAKRPHDFYLGWPQSGSGEVRVTN